PDATTERYTLSLHERSSDLFVGLNIDVPQQRNPQLDHTDDPVIRPAEVVRLQVRVTLEHAPSILIVAQVAMRHNSIFYLQGDDRALLDRARGAGDHHKVAVLQRRRHAVPLDGNDFVPSIRNRTIRDEYQQ